MAGILANSASETMTGGDTAPDQSVAGYLVGEQITLSTEPSGSAVWGLSKPAGATKRSDLSTGTGTTTTFRPDVEGYYVVTATVGSTVYVLRIATLALGVVSSVSALRLLPLTDAQVPAPATGATLFYSTAQDAIAAKLPDGSVVTIDTTVVP